jgi:GTP-binding protein YchF
MKLGIVGLPNVGKSTFFNSLTKAGASAANHPFSTVTPNVGIVSVPDGRLDFLETLYTAKKNTPATIEFVDIAGLVHGSSRGGGLGNKFLQYIREVDALVHVVRCFEDDNVIHVEDNIDAAHDIETINLELILADIEVIERRISKEQKTKADKNSKRYLEILEYLNENLSSGKNARELDYKPLGMTVEDYAFLDSLTLLSHKPVLYAANVGEDDISDYGSSNPNIKKIKEIAENEKTSAFTICAKLEEELSTLPDDERTAFLRELGCEKSGLELIIVASYALLGLISFLTAGPKEVRAWTIKNGSTAPKAAGKIHSDLERGFIRAEIVHFDDLKRLGSHSAAKDAGLVRSEGKEYVVKDGDVILFRFNV